MQLVFFVVANRASVNTFIMRRSSQLAVVNNSENNRKLICTFWRLLAPERKIMPCSLVPTTDPPWTCDLWFLKSKLMMIRKARLRFHNAHLLSSKWWWLDPSFMYSLWAQLSFRAEQIILSPAAAHNSETGVSLRESLLIGKEMSLMITTNVTWWVCCQELGDYPLLMWSDCSLRRLKISSLCLALPTQVKSVCRKHGDNSCAMP